MTAKIAKAPRSTRPTAVLASVLPIKRTRATKHAAVASAVQIASLPPVAPTTSRQAAKPIVAQQPDSPARATRRDQIIALLNQANGASIAELMTATDWLPHTTRAALSGLRKAGMMLGRTSEDGVSRYRIAVAA